jgi:CheY-like chemotaxis protein
MPLGMFDLMNMERFVSDATTVADCSIPSMPSGARAPTFGGDGRSVTGQGRDHVVRPVLRGRETPILMTSDATTVNGDGIAARWSAGYRPEPEWEPAMERAMIHNDVIGTGWSHYPVIRLLLVDDQPQVRRGLVMRLALEPDVEVVGECGDAESAIELARSLRPDVVIMDVELPGMNGIDATRTLRTALPRTAIVMLSLHDDNDTVARAKAAGAACFVAKHRMEGPLLAAIRDAATPIHG